MLTVTMLVPIPNSSPDLEQPQSARDRAPEGKFLVNMGFPRCYLIMQLLFQCGPVLFGTLFHALLRRFQAPEAFPSNQSTDHRLPSIVQLSFAGQCFESSVHLDGVFFRVGTGLWVLLGVYSMWTFAQERNAAQLYHVVDWKGRIIIAVTIATQSAWPVSCASLWHKLPNSTSTAALLSL